MPDGVPLLEGKGRGGVLGLEIIRPSEVLGKKLSLLQVFDKYLSDVSVHSLQ